MPPLVTRTEWLVVNGVPLSTPAWWITNLDPELLSAPAIRGDDLLVPHATGVLPNRRRITATVKQLAMVVSGNNASDGTVNSNWRTGLITNVEYLNANLGLASATGAGTVTATWHRWDGSTKTAAVHVLGLVTQPLVQRHISAVLTLSIPLGVFA